jgi:outer membrane protein insertion porin family
MVRKLFAIFCFGFVLTHSLTQAQDNYEIKAFRFEGVRLVSESALREALATKSGPWRNRFLFRKGPLFSVEEFQRDLQRIAKFYEREGFFQARIVDQKIVANDKSSKSACGSKSKKTSRRASSTSSWRRPILIRAAARRGALQGADSARRQSSARSGAAGLSGGAGADLTNHGYPYANVKPSQTHDESQTAKVVFRVDPGPACVFGEVQITGNRRIPQRVIRDELRISAGRFTAPAGYPRPAARVSAGAFSIRQYSRARRGPERQSDTHRGAR